MDLGDTLVIRPGALGDAVLTLPALHALRSAGARHLTVLGTFPHWGFVRKSHEGLRVRDFASSEWLGLFAPDVPLGPSACAALAQTQTAIVCLTDAPEVRQVLERHGIRQVLFAAPPVSGGEGLPPERRERTQTADAAAPADVCGAHAAQRLLAPLREILPIEACRSGLRRLAHDGDEFLRIEEHERILALDKLGLDTLPDGGMVALHPGSGGRRKCWRAERYARLAAELSCKRGLLPVVFFGPADEAVRESFEQAMPPGVAWECASQWPLREVLALLTLCRACIGNDSGISHLAARACPVAALFGPTDPRVWHPVGRTVKTVAAAQNDLDRITADDVLAALDGLLR